MDRGFSLLFGSKTVEKVLDGNILDLVKALGSATTAKLFLFKDDGICIFFLKGEDIVITDIVADSDLIGDGNSSSLAEDTHNLSHCFSHTPLLIKGT